MALPVKPGPARILIIDDDEDFAGVLRAALSPLGAEVICCISGEEGLQQAATGRVGVILLDILMPGAHGLHVLARLKADPVAARIPVLVISSLRAAEVKERALQAGAVDFLPKDIDMKDLAAKVAAALAGKAAPRDARLGA